MQNWIFLRLNTGFSYIELILYVAIVVLMITALIPFAWNVIGAGAKSTTEQEVFSNARYISNRLQSEIRNAANISTMSATQITLSTSIPSTNPTVIGLSGGNLTITQGVGSALSLNSQNSSISALAFTNFTSADNKSKHIQFIFTVNANYSGAGPRHEYNESTTIESSAEIRNN